MKLSFKNLTSKIIIFLFYFFIFILLLVQLLLFLLTMLNFSYTFDTAWIIESGKYIAENKSLPKGDIFSWTFEGKEWILYQWLFEVITASFYKFLGEDLLVRVFTIFIAAIYFFIPLIMNQLKKIPVFYTLIISLLCLFTASVNISIRPMIATLFLLMLQYYLFEFYRERKITRNKLLFFLIPMYAIWANVHLGIVLGLLSQIFFAISSIIKDQTKTKDYLFLTISSFLSSLINPYGFQIYTYLTNLSTNSYLNKVIIELQPPNYELLNYKAFILLLLILIVLLTRTKTNFTSYEVLHLVTFTVLTLFCQRFVVWACLYYTLIFPKALNNFLTSLKNNYIFKLVKNSHKFCTLSVYLVLIIIIIFLFFQKPYPAIKLGACKEYTNSIKTYQILKLPTDRLFNDPYVGSCSIAINPKSKVFIDTRFDFYGEGFTKEVTSITKLQNKNWIDFFKKWDINTLILDKSLPLSKLLKNFNEFKILYEDSYVLIARKQ